MPQIGQVRLIRQDWHVSRKLSRTLSLTSIARRNRCLAARTKETFRSYPFQDDERETLLKAREHALPENFIYRVSAVSPTIFAATRDRKLLFPLCDSGCEKTGPTRARVIHVMRQHCGQRSTAVCHGGAKDRSKYVDARRIAPASSLAFHKQLASPNIQVSWYRFCSLAERFPTVQLLADKRRRVFAAAKTDP